MYILYMYIGTVYIYIYIYSAYIYIYAYFIYLCKFTSTVFTVHETVEDI